MLNPKVGKWLVVIHRIAAFFAHVLVAVLIPVYQHPSHKIKGANGGGMPQLTIFRTF
jgi:hypothetical protein